MLCSYHDLLSSPQTCDRRLFHCSLWNSRSLVTSFPYSYIPTAHKTVSSTYCSPELQLVCASEHSISQNKLIISAPNSAIPTASVSIKDTIRAHAVNMRIVLDICLSFLLLTALHPIHHQIFFVPPKPHGSIHFSPPALLACLDGLSPGLPPQPPNQSSCVQLPSPPIHSSSKSDL